MVITVNDCVTVICDNMLMDVLYFRYFDINLVFCFYYKLFYWSKGLDNRLEVRAHKNVLRNVPIVNKNIYC